MCITQHMLRAAAWVCAWACHDLLCAVTRFTPGRCSAPAPAPLGPSPSTAPPHPVRPRLCFSLMQCNLASLQDRGLLLPASAASGCSLSLPVVHAASLTPDILD